MPLFDDENLDSSPGDEAVKAPPTDKVDGQAPADADSSAATDETEGNEEILNVVRDAVGEKDKSKSEAASSAEGDEDGDDTEAQRPKEPDDENYTDVPFHKHPRFQQVLRRSKEYEVDATRYRNLQNFLDEGGVKAEDAATHLKVLALANVDPAGAWQQIKPWVQKLLVASGEVIPDDIRRRVDAGEITKEFGQELARERAKAASAEGRSTFEQQRNERRQGVERQQMLMNAANGWETERHRKDPNFEAKLEPLQKEVLFLQRQEGVPNTPEGVKDQLDRAYKTVNASLRSASPTPRRQQGRPSSNGSVAGNARDVKPDSTLGVIEDVLAKHARA